MTLRAFVIAYPWDLLDGDLAAVLDRLHGEVGATGVSVWMASPSLTQLRIRDVLPRVFRTQGGLFFHPEEKHYVATRCKPIVSSWAKGRNALGRIAEACADRAMELCVIVSAAAAGRLALRHPEMACKNAFGDESHMNVCLANSDVQAYLCGLLSDLSSNNHLSGLTVTDFCLSWGEAFAADLRVPMPLSQVDRCLLSTCFCESCHQLAGGAGVDAAMAQRAVRTIVQKRLEHAPATSRPLDAVLGDNPPLADFHRWRAVELSSLLKRLVTSCSCDLLLDRGVSRVDSAQDREPDLTLPAAVVTALDRPEELPSMPFPTARRNELRLTETFAIGSLAPQLVRTLSHAAELGYSGVHFDNYGLLPESALTAVKQAIRFARRSTGE